MTVKIAVVCALPPERNTGMATVDLAAHRYFRRFNGRAEVTLYSFGKTTPYGYAAGELPFAHVDILTNQARYLASDIFVFWGDFIHSHSYQKFDIGAWSGADANAARARYQAYCRHVFLSETDVAVIRRSVVFGGTIITNEAADDLDHGYQLPFERLFRRLGGVFFRDALSTAMIAPLRGGQATQGCDCALLLEDKDLAELDGFQMAASREGVGVFFGRSRWKTLMLLFSRVVAAKLGERPGWLPWFWSVRRVRWPARLFGFAVPPVQPSPGALLSQLSGCRFVITDTYHVCVNAWRLGIPAICIGAGASVSSDSLADKKKETLFTMYGGRRLYVFTETLLHPGTFIRAARMAAAAVGDPALTGQVVANIRAHRAMALDGLTERLEHSLTELGVMEPA
jgi:hypothetical protein